MCTKAPGSYVQVKPSVWVRHVLRDSVDVYLRPSDTPALDSEGRTVSGLDVGDSRGVVPPHRLDSPDSGFRALPISVGWDRRFADLIQRVSWVRKPVFIELSEGRTTRVFQWYIYLTPHAAEVPRHHSQYDDHPHYSWTDGEDGPLSHPGVAQRWIELPGPLGSPTLPPACWVQPEKLGPDAPNEPRQTGEIGPDSTVLVPVFPVEPPLQIGLEAVGWNGALGGQERRPQVQALAVRSAAAAGTWGAYLHYWDTPDRGPSRVERHNRTTVLEPPTDCVWPRLESADEQALVLYDLVGRGEGGCEVKVNFRVRLPPEAESVVLERADVRLGAEPVGRWLDGPLELAAGHSANLTCTVDLHHLRDAADGRLKLTLAFQGRPTRGVLSESPLFRTENGPFARLMRSRAQEDGGVRTPWLIIDLGSEGTCAAVAFLDGYVPRVISVNFDGGPIYPSRVYLSPGLGGVYSLADSASDDVLYTTLIKLGLRFGDGAHPGCPDHIAATEVARFFLKRFLLEVKERMAWFPLEDTDVLVSFPPRLAAMPRFVSSLRDTFASVLGEVVWTGPAQGRLRFREEAFLVSVPALYKDLEVAPMAPGRSRYYWVMDFGGGTTDVCGFLCTADAYGEEQTVSHLTYPQRLPHHLAGNDVMRAFYRMLYTQLVAAGVVAGPDHGASGAALGTRRFPLPPEPLPSVRSTPVALSNQTALRELADAVKCLPVDEHHHRTVRDVARTLASGRIVSSDGVATSLVALLAGEASALGDRSIHVVHAEVLEPGAHILVPVAQPVKTDPMRGERTLVQCVACGESHTLPVWAFSKNLTFRFRCRACGRAQHVRLTDEGLLPHEGDDTSPTILDYRDASVREPSPDVGTGELYVEQDGRTYVVKDWDTMRRWVEERRVGPEDLFSEGGIAWQPVQEWPQFHGMFEAAAALAVDTTQEAPRDPRTPIPASEPVDGDRPALGRDLSLFLRACREALDHAVDALPDPENTEIVVLTAGRASQFPQVIGGVLDHMPGRVVHLTNEWVRRSYGGAGQIDPRCDLKTMAVNGGGLFALLQSNPETSHLLLSFDTQVMECAVYLQAATTDARPWLITRQLDLRAGHALPLVGEREAVQVEAADQEASAAEPPPRALPLQTPLTGDLRLVVDGLPEDRGWEPYVAIARGTARRVQGRRPRTSEDTELRTEESRFVLAPLSDEGSVSFVRLLPRLDLLGGGELEGHGEEPDPA